MFEKKNNQRLLEIHVEYDFAIISAKTSSFKIL